MSSCLQVLIPWTGSGRSIGEGLGIYLFVDVLGIVLKHGILSNCDINMCSFHCLDKKESCGHQGGIGQILDKYNTNDTL